MHGFYAPTPLHSYVHLNFTCQVVVVQAKSVIHTFEKAIHAFSRPVDPEIETGTQQVGGRQVAGCGARPACLGLPRHPKPGRGTWIRLGMEVDIYCRVWPARRVRPAWPHHCHTSHLPLPPMVTPPHLRMPSWWDPPALPQPC